MEHLKALIRTISDFPKPGIEFRDLTTLFMDPKGLQETVHAMAAPYMGDGIDMVVGIESRGFILAAPVAMALDTGFVPVRKPGKLPGKTLGVDYSLEYGEDRLEIHTDALEKGMRVLVVDDLLATGGTMEATCKLLEKMECEVASCAFVVELVDLKGRERLLGQDIFRLIEFEGA